MLPARVNHFMARSVLPIELATRWEPATESMQPLATAANAHALAAYIQARERLVDTDPVRHCADCPSPLSVMDEAVYVLVSLAWANALRLGYRMGQYAEDALPTLVLAEHDLCPTCQGSGRLWAGSWVRPTTAPAEAATACATCDGAGVAHVTA
jgi:hypothetical protein